MIHKHLRLIRTNSDHPAFAELIHQLDQELSTRYGEIQKTYDQFNKISGIDTVVIAFDHDAPIGCGCFKPFGDRAVELKRLFVIQEKRGNGIAASIVQDLEQWAKELNYESSVLETGDQQPEAIALYTRLGYERIPNFGRYKGMASSICFAKKIND